MINLKIDGFEESLKKLADVVRPVNDRRISEHGALALEPVAEMARSLVLVDSGDLRETITVSYEYKSAELDGAAVYVGPLGAGVSPGAEHVYYAHFLEYGTVNHPAEPFLAPAVHHHRKLIFDTLSVRIGKDMTGAI